MLISALSRLLEISCEPVSAEESGACSRGLEDTGKNCLSFECAMVTGNACRRCLLSLTCRGNDCESKTKREITMITAANKPVKPYFSCNKYSLSRTMDAGTAALEMSYWKDFRAVGFASDFVLTIS